jgi:small neutral amino acid transporter SnatA (MarC family)
MRPLSESTRYRIIVVAAILLLATTITQGIQRGFGPGNYVSIAGGVIMLAVSARMLTRGRS